MFSFGRKVFLRVATAALAALFVTTAAFGLDPRTPLTEYGRRLWRIDDGLPNAACRAFAQTPDGYMWIGTQDGVARFDGARFVTMTSINMRNAWVQALTVSPDGALWLGLVTIAVVDKTGATNPGLLRYQKGVETEYRELKVFSTQEVAAVANGPDKAIWLGTDAGLIRRDANGALRKWSRKDGLTTPIITALQADRQGTLWIGTERGLMKLSHGSIVPVAGMPPRFIRSLQEDAKGALWIGTDRGVFCLDHGAFVDHPELHDIAGLVVSAIIEDSTHTLWFGTSNGLKRLKADGTSDPVTAAGLASSYIRALFEDREHNLWVGTMNGVTQLRDTAFRMYGAAEGFRDGAVLSLTEDNAGAMWLGFYDGLVRMAGGKQHLFRREDGLSNNIMSSMTPSRLGGVWVATLGGGVCHVQEGARPRCYGEAEGLPNNVTRAVYEDDKGGLWISSAAGLSYLKDGRAQTFGVADGLPVPPEILTIVPAQNGGVWLGDARFGVFLFKDGHVVRRERPKGLGGPRCVLDQPDGSLFIAYEWGGLILIKDGKVTEFTLPILGGGKRTLSVVDGGAFLWVTTSRDVLRLDKSELFAYAAGRTKAIHPTVCGPSDGMTSSEFPRSQASAFRARDGSIWFNGSKGAARLDLRAFGVRKPAHPVALVESLTAAGRELSGDHPIVDGRGVRLLFRYTANSFSDADQLTFRYKLDGYDSGWIDAGKTRSAVYTNLPPGDYVFRVVSAGANGKWNDAGSAAFAFSRRPTLTETKWFYAACVLCLMGLVSLGFRARVQTLKRRELILARRVRDQTETLSRQTETLSQQTEALTELSAKQSMILGSAGDGIIGLDAAGRISFINPSGAQMLGWSIDELLGRALHELVHSSPAETESPAETCFVCGTQADPPIRAAKSDFFRSRSGKTIPVELTSSTITTGGEGRPIGVVVTFRDITERHELERMKSEFVSTVSHELRAPLTSIRGALGLLAAGLFGSFEPKAKRMLDIASTNCDRLIRLINDILDIERIESGRVELDRKPTDGEKLLTQAAETMQAMADRAGVRLEVGAAPGIVNVDPDRILQVITNLLSNAFKFSTAGSTVTLTSDCHDAIFSVHVSDQGRGIPEAKLALVFERFQQVDASDARDKGGTGLGLAICRSIALAHGGDISVESTEGVGSTFHLTIPDQAALPPALVSSLG